MEREPAMSVKGGSALREVLERGVRQAVRAAELMLGRPVRMTLARIKAVPADAIFEGRFRADSPLAMVVLRIDDQGGGFLLLMMDEDSARTLNALLWGGVPGAGGPLTADGISALKEMANIVGSSFLNALADAAQVALRPSEPIFLYDMLAAVIQTLLVEQGIDTDRILLIGTSLACADADVCLDFLFLPSPALIETVLGSLGDA